MHCSGSYIELPTNPYAETRKQSRIPSSGFDFVVGISLLRNQHSREKQIRFRFVWVTIRVWDFWGYSTIVLVDDDDLGLKKD